MKEHSHELVRLNTVMDLKAPSLSEEEKKEQTYQQNLEELGTQLREKISQYEKAKQKFDSANEKLQKDAEEVDKKEELLQTLQTGVASKEGTESGYQGQLQEARQRMTSSSTEQEQGKLKISHLEKRIREEEPRAKKAKDQNSGLLKDLEALRAQASKLESQLSKAGFDPAKEEHSRVEASSLQKQVRELGEQADAVKRKVANIDFNYADPSPGFDRSKVKGLVAQLFTLNKEHSKAGTALEICAGGRLYNVVVDTAETGTDLLQNGKLKKRVTIIPLNKISALKASADVGYFTHVILKASLTFLT